MGCAQHAGIPACLPAGAIASHQPGPIHGQLWPLPANG